ncbi:hypothetical protein ACPXCP_33915 [Streptomyces sp. DT20]|uniref:hypothetical protein n=1 Tax=Streptomyces sp. DT20 TaxID=3416519 RepID=UPI003CEE00ED
MITNTMRGLAAAALTALPLFVAVPSVHAVDMTAAAPVSFGSERALNAEEALKTSNEEIRTQHGRIASCAGGSATLNTTTRATPSSGSSPRAPRSSRRSACRGTSSWRTDCRFLDKRTADLEALLAERTTPSLPGPVPEQR